jgi:hypothetical protein
MEAGHLLRRRRRKRPIWTTPVVAAAAVLGVGVWLGSAHASARMVPTFVSRARAGIQQLGAAVLNRFRATEASVATGQQGTSATSTPRPPHRRPRVVPFSKKP